MTIRETKKEVEYTLTFSAQEAQDLMNVCEFALDYEAVKPNSLREDEILLAKKLSDYLESSIFSDTKEL